MRKITAFLIVLHIGYPCFIDTSPCSFYDSNFLRFVGYLSEIWIHVHCITLILNFYRYTFSMWLCNAYQFRLHKWIFVYCLHKRKTGLASKWQLFSFSVIVLMLKEANFQNSLFLYNYFNYVTWFTLDNAFSFVLNVEITIKRIYIAYQIKLCKSATNDV